MLSSAPGGRLLIGNFHEKNPTRIYMDYILDWDLFYRNEESFLRITKGLPGSFSSKILYEIDRCQMFLDIKKNAVIKFVFLFQFKA